MSSAALYRHTCVQWTASFRKTKRQVTSVNVRSPGSLATGRRASSFDARRRLVVLMICVAERPTSDLFLLSSVRHYLLRLAIVCSQGLVASLRMASVVST